MGMRVDIVTLFPEMCQQVLDASILGRAAKKGYIETHCHQIRRRLRHGAVRPAHRGLPPRRAEGSGGTGTPQAAYCILDGGRPALHRRARPEAGGVRQPDAGLRPL